MLYTVEHSIQFRDGTATAPYRLTTQYRTVKGALRAGERHAVGMDRYYDAAAIHKHAIVIRDETGAFVTNMAA